MVRVMTEKQKQYIRDNSAAYTIREMCEKLELKKGTVSSYITAYKLPYKHSSLCKYKNEVQVLDYDCCPITGLKGGWAY